MNTINYFKLYEEQLHNLYGAICLFSISPLIIYNITIFITTFNGHIEDRELFIMFTETFFINILSPANLTLFACWLIMACTLGANLRRHLTKPRLTTSQQIETTLLLVISGDLSNDNIQQIKNKEIPKIYLTK